MIIKYMQEEPLEIVPIQIYQRKAEIMYLCRLHCKKNGYGKF